LVQGIHVEVIVTSDLLLDNPPGCHGHEAKQDYNGAMTGLEKHAQARRLLLIGTLCGVVSALGYSAANIFLRRLVSCDPTWVSTVKSVPTILLVIPWLLIRRRAGIKESGHRRSLLVLLAAGLIGSVMGNVAFQWSLGIVGLAIAVPICFGSMLVSSPLLSRAVLGEEISTRTILAMAVLILSIILLAARVEPIARVGASGTAVLVAILLLCMAGIAYTMLGVGIRYGLDNGISLPVTLGIISVSGFLFLGSLSLRSIGWDAMLATESHHLVDMFLAGLFNAVAFLSLTRAIQLTSVTYVNLINASQVAIAALTGVMLFQETPTILMMIGVVLTIAGLMLMQRPSHRQDLKMALNRPE
jgi:drug/metabolite transporter (DMT)-like permease